VDVLELLQPLADSYAPLAQAQGLQFSIDCPPGLTVLADPARLTQVLDNLLSNALKYTPSGSIRVHCSPDGAMVSIAITDTGVGIDPQHIPHLGERFFRPDASRTRQAGGTGLGLAVVKQLVAALGGTLAFDSQVGVGTRVTVKLPFGPMAA
jgi:two-component system, OmpR family, sensor histidine kinase BaeS